MQALPRRGPGNPGRRVELNETTSGQFSGVLRGFNFMPLANATMFRFALRSKASDLSDRWLSREVFTPAQIKEIALAFAATAYEILFFLKSIRKIEFYELERTTNCASSNLTE